MKSMKHIDIKSEPVSTVKVTGTSWNPNAGREQFLAKQAERQQAFKEAQLAAGKDLETRLLMMEGAIAHLQDELKALKENK